MGYYSLGFEEISCNDKEHLQNHLNYLFRTDREQKWTNNLTEKNVVLMFTDSGSLIDNLPKAREARTDIKNEIQRCITLYLQREELSYNSIKMVRCEFKNVEIYQFDDEMYEKMVQSVEVLCQEYGMRLFVLVTHIDQCNAYTHFHLVCGNKSFRGISELLKVKINE